MMHVLVTGGAGFIGTHLSRRLLREKCRVTILDNFSPQIHGDQRNLPDDLAGQVRLIVGDVRDRGVLNQALDGQDIVVHLAAETGTGQSMYEIERYASINMGGTALLFECLVSNPGRVRKIVLASSRAVYGEGKYQCPACGIVYPAMRQVDDILTGQFEPRCPRCAASCALLATDESAPYQPASFYGLTKQVQEQIVLMFAPRLNLSAFVLRYQNVYGPGQSLQNPYTGILAIFTNQARQSQPINVFEDGEESRDFVYVDDAVEATWRCIQPAATGSQTLNVGSGESVTVRTAAQAIIQYFNSSSAINVTGTFRAGDIRHSLADLSNIRRHLDFEPRWKFSDGIREFLKWAETQTIEANRYEPSLAEMRSKGLMYGGL